VKLGYANGREEEKQEQLRDHLYRFKDPRERNSSPNSPSIVFLCRGTVDRRLLLVSWYGIVAALRRCIEESSRFT